MGVEQEEKIIEEAGFRRGYSTVDFVFTLHVLVQKFLVRLSNRRTEIYCGVYLERRVGGGGGGEGVSR